MNPVTSVGLPSLDPNVLATARASCPPYTGNTVELVYEGEANALLAMATLTPSVWLATEKVLEQTINPLAPGDNLETADGTTCKLVTVHTEASSAGLRVTASRLAYSTSSHRVLLLEPEALTTWLHARVAAVVDVAFANTPALRSKLEYVFECFTESVVVVVRLNPDDTRRAINDFVLGGHDREVGQALWEETLRVCPELTHLRSFVETAAARKAVDPPGQ